MTSAESERGRGLSNGGSTLGVNSIFTRRQRDADQCTSDNTAVNVVNVKAIGVEVAAGLISIEDSNFAMLLNQNFDVVLPSWVSL